MTLTLRAVSLNDHPLTQPITVHFDAQGGSIGRADHNTMALPDPKRHISRQQAEVRTVGSGFTITNVGSANPIAVGNRTLARGESTALAQGDVLRIGGYLLEVEVGASAEAQTIVRGRAAVDTAASPAMRPHEPAGSAVLGPFGNDDEAPLSPGNPFASLFDGDAARVTPQHAARGEGAPRLSVGSSFASLLGGEEAARESVPPRGGSGFIGGGVAAVSTTPPVPDASPGSSCPDAAAGPPFPAAPVGSAIAAVPANPRVPTAPAGPPFLAAPARPPTAAHSAGPPSAVGPSGPPVAARLPAADPASGAVWPRLPDDFDPFAPPLPVPPPPAAPSPSASAFGDLVPGAEPGSIDDLFGLGARRGAGRDPLAGFLDAPPPLASTRSAAASPLSTDPLALFGPPGRAAPPPDGRPTASDHVPQLQTAFAPPRLVRAAPSATPPSPHEPAPDRAAPSPWAAFCEGAGVRLAQPAGGDVAAMREIGTVLRAAIDGTLRLMAVRASAKHELHAPVTVIQPQHNNPLKFSPDVDSALEQLLQPPVRGFMPGAPAVQDAMDDLVGHAIGTLAGTRAALEGVLDRFAPHRLESKLAARSVIDSILPGNRKARLWELYLQHFETIRGEAQDDFHSLFGRAFLAAYETQLERLQGR